MKTRARLFTVIATLTMLWGTASAAWPLSSIPGWPHD
jgi:hypothetical protein